MKFTQYLLALFCGALLNTNVSAQISVVEPGFEIINTFSVPAELTYSLGTMMFSADGNTVYILDESESASSAVWTAALTRDGEGNVTGFGTFTPVFSLGNMDTGLEFGPGTDTFFFSIASDGIGQRLAGGSIEITAVSPYDNDYGGLAFIPGSFTLGGDIVTTSYGDGTLYRHTTTPDGDGSFTVNGTGTLYADLSASIGTSVLGDIIFITSGALAGNAMLATYDNSDSAIYFPVAADGLPAGGTTPTPQVFATGTSGAWGMATDPVTDNIWIIDYDESEGPALVQIGDTTSAVPPPISEGIPVSTLNPYGLAMLVLLMLGIGLVGFRRTI